MPARSTPRPRRAPLAFASSLAATAVLLAAALGAARVAGADDEIEIAWRFEPGLQRVFESYTEMWMTRQVGDGTPGKVHLEVSQRFEDTYGEADAEGLIPYWHILRAVRVDASYGRDHILFDSKTDKASDRKALDPRVKPFVAGLDEVRMTKIDPKKGVTVSEDRTGEAPFLAGRKAAIGGTWVEERRTRVGTSELVLTERFTLTRVEPFLGRKRCAWVDVALERAVSGAADDDPDGPVEIVSATGAGEAVFDLDAGLIVRRRIEERLVVRRRIPQKDGKSVAETEERRLKTTVELTEERATAKKDK